MSQPTYRFKWTNIDLDDYMRGRRSVAQQKRRDAEILVKQAEAIEMEMGELSVALVVEEENESQAS